MKDRLLRTLAEMENLRRRTEREVSDAKTYGVDDVSPATCWRVVDNLARALEHLPAEARANADGALQSLIEGVELTARDLEAALGRHGVKKLDPKGAEIRPEFPSGDFRGARRDRSRRHSQPGGAKRLDDWRSRAAPGDGRRLQGRARRRRPGRSRRPAGNSR